MHYSNVERGVGQGVGQGVGVIGYGYCPACHKPQGDQSHAWVHQCGDGCKSAIVKEVRVYGAVEYRKLCERRGRAIFMCQRD